MLEDGSLKRCPKCGEFKPRDAFSKCASRKDGCQAYCKMCRSAHHAANKETISAKRHEYYIANRETIIARVRAYAATHADAIRERNQAYHARTREARKAYRYANRAAIEIYMINYRAINGDKLRAYSREWAKKHPDKVRLRCQERRVRLKNSEGKFTYEEFRAMKIAQAGVCAYCQQYKPQGLTIDHIIPLKRGGKHEASNICLACSHCNFSKGAKLLSEWTNRWYWRELE